MRLDPVNHLPRFNMPLELGLFLGCKCFGGPRQSKKVCLILDVHPYRYQKFISDIAGNDIHCRGASPEEAIIVVRDWLAAASKRRQLPGGAEIVRRYHRFRDGLPRLCEETRLDPDAMTFTDLSRMITAWLKTRR